MGEDSVPILAEVLKRHSSTKVQKRAVEALGTLVSPRAIEPLCLTLLESRETELTRKILEALQKITDWKAKTASFISLLQEGEYRRSDLLGREIVAALNPAVEVLGENPFTLTDYLIENCIDRDARMNANLAALIIASTSGDLAVAGNRINTYASAKGISEKTLDNLRIEIGGETALDPVLRMLSKRPALLLPRTD